MARQKGWKDMNLIEVNGVSKQFKNQTALKETTIPFEEGKIHGIVGMNGSGKTVFLKLLCGLLCPTAGAITVCGKVLGKDRDFAPDTGILIETPNFLPYKSGMGNLWDLASIQRKVGKEQIAETMLTAGLDPASKKWVGKYSLGMRQRLGIAQAIMEDPALLLLDEPMNGLDKRGCEDMRALFSGLRDAGKTIVLASHIAEDIQVLCDTVCEMENGVLSKTKGWDIEDM